MGYPPGAGRVCQRGPASSRDTAARERHRDRGTAVAIPGHCAVLVAGRHPAAHRHANAGSTVVAASDASSDARPDAPSHVDADPHANADSHTYTRADGDRYPVARAERVAGPVSFARAVAFARAERVARPVPGARSVGGAVTMIG
jgi:hypothetical protein